MDDLEIRKLPELKGFLEIANQDNIIKTLVWDPVGRDEQLAYFLRLLDSLDNGTGIVVLNAKWGSGKTFFAKQFEFLINDYAVRNDKDIDEIAKKMECYKKEKAQFLNNRISYFDFLKEEVRLFVANKIPTVLYFNAWECDEQDDPIKSLMYFLIRKYKLSYERFETDIAELIGSFLGKYNVGKVIKEKKLFEDIISADEIKVMWENLIEQCIVEQCESLYWIIDDLDRCRPVYAIKMLERLKHFANHERLTFILAMDCDEMAKIISAYYGYRGYGERYLEKIVDETFSLNTRSYEMYSDYIGRFTGRKCKNEEFIHVSDIVLETSKYLFEYYGFTFRQMAKYATTVNYIMSYYDGYFSERAGDKGNSIIKGIVMPYVLATRISSNKKYNKFINGEGENQFEKFVMKSQNMTEYFQPNPHKKIKKLYFFLTKVLNSDIEIIETKDIGNIRIYEDTIKHMIEAMNYNYDFEIATEEQAD